MKPPQHDEARRIAANNAKLPAFIEAERIEKQRANEVAGRRYRSDDWHRAPRGRVCGLLPQGSARPDICNVWA